MKPRGTTVSVYRDTSEQAGRQKPWGVIWNEYRPGIIGRPKRRSRWYATEAEALAVAAKVRAALESSAPLPLDDTEAPLRRADTLAAKVPEFLAHKQAQKEAATHLNYRDCFRNYLAPKPGHKRYPGLGNLVITDAAFVPKVVADYLMKLHAEGVSLSMRRRVQRTISSFGTYARFAGWITKPNPCFGLGSSIKQKGEANEDPSSNPFDRDEVARLFDYFEACEPDWLPYFTFLYHTGVRPGEAAGLQWDDCDFQRMRAHIQRAWSPAAHANKDPKTHENRWIDLSRTTVDRLLGWRPIQRQELLRRVIQQSPYVFTSRRGTRALQDGNVRLVLERALRSCNITGHSLYDFRHSFASHHLSDNWARKLTWVSKQLGHKHVSTTEKCYFKYVPTAANLGFADEIR